MSSDTAQAPRKLGFRADVNGLRAIAVLAVLAFHFRIAPLSSGFVGVDVFFVISGYLMTGITVSRLDSHSFSLLGFYLDRARRILPPLLIMITAVLVLGYFILFSDEYLILSKHAAASATFLSNILYWRELGYFDPGAEQKWLLHTWSLSVEWQFYILYPLIVAGVARFARPLLPMVLAALAITSFACMLWLNQVAPDTSFYMLPMRAWEMLVGGLTFLAPALRGRLAYTAHVLGLGVVCVSCVALTPVGWPNAWALVPAVGTALVILAGRYDSPLTGNPVARWIGLNSYSLYLWHWPIVVYLVRENLINDPGAVALGLGLSFVIGHLSWRFVEQWGQRHPAKPRIHVAQQRRREWRAHATYAVATVSILVPSVLIWGSRGLPQRFSAEIQAIDHDARPDIVPGSAKCVSHGGEMPEQCIIGSPIDAVSVTLIGDSHAESALPGVLAALPPGNRGGIAFSAYILCPPILDAFNTQPGNKCGPFLKRYLEPLTQKRDTPVILASFWPTYEKGRSSILFPGGSSTPSEAEYRSHLFASACALAKGGPTFVILPLPDFGFEVSNELRKRLNRDPSAPEISIPLKAYEARNRTIIPVLRRAANECGVRLLDPTQYLCTGGRCYGSMNRRALFRDTNHLSTYGSRKLAPMFREVFSSPRTAALSTAQ